MEALPAGDVTTIPKSEDGKRPLGRYKGQIEIGPEFFELLPDDELELWEGKHDGQEFGKTS
jgi:hypothetical protein